MSYVIVTDTTTDLPESYYREHQLTVLPLSYILDGETYYRGGKELPYQEFYAKMRAGSMPTTSQINPQTARRFFEPIVKEGKDILYIGFSSGLSGSCGSAQIAAQDLMDEYPGRKIVVVDSLCASLGEGLLVHKALEKKEQGMSLEELADWCEQHKRNIIHSFTVDDLFHLHRGGRVSKVAAVVGTVISLKPILHVNNEGKLIPLYNVRKRKKSLQALVDAMEQKQGSYSGKNDIVFISHGDCLADAEYVKSLVQERFGITKFIINPVGPVIGAHSGPGTLALFFMGDERE